LLKHNHPLGHRDRLWTMRNYHPCQLGQLDRRVDQLLIPEIQVAGGGSMPFRVERDIKPDVW
jgi:hypothetical protein